MLYLIMLYFFQIAFCNKETVRIAALQAYFLSMKTSNTEKCNRFKQSYVKNK